jgi:hypothetical protein
MLSPLEDMFLKGNSVIKLLLRGKDMQTKPLLKKGLVVGIIVLLGTNITPAVTSSSSGRVIAGGKLNPTSLSGSREIIIGVTGTEGWNDWFVSNVVITFTCNESGHLYYKINNGSWTDDYHTPITISVDGYYTVSAYLVYENGTQSPIVSVSFKIDKTPPVVAQFTVKRYFFFTWKLTADVYDNMSGVNSVWMGVDDVWANLTSPPYGVFWSGLMFLVYWKFGRTGDFSILPHCEPYDNAGNSPLQPL